MPKIAYEEVENASIDEIRNLQLTRLKQTLRHAYDNSASYKRKFAEHNVHPNDLRSLEDLSRFPFTTKSDLRENYPFGMFCTPMREISRIHASSGTTGRPTVVGYTKRDIENWANLVARSIYAAGGRPGDKVHVSYGYGLFTGGLGAHYGAEKLGCTVIPMSGGQTEKQVKLIQDFDPDIIMVTPSYMLNIADEMRRQGVDPKQLSLRTGIFGAEPWTDSMRKELESTLHIDAVDIYGLSEIMGPGVAQECVETKDGPTVWEDHFFPEVIDPQTGRVLPDGEKGELVLSTLTKEGLPMIRYRTRDLTRLLPGSARTMRRIEKITGRSDDMLIIRGVNVFPTQIEEQILSVKGLSPHYLMEIDKKGNLDSVRIMVECVQGYPADAQVVAAELQTKIKSLVGISTSVEVKEVGELPRSEGKAKHVIDLRNDQYNKS
jgi:phenylacetate-CoA ligase